MTPETRRILADNLNAALDSITWAEKRVPRGRPQLALFLVNARNFLANAQAALDAEEPAPTCETCGGSRVIHETKGPKAPRMAPCPDCAGEEE